MTKETTTPNFKADDGTVWPLVLTIGRVRALKDELGVDIGGDPSALFMAMANDRVQLASVLWVIVEPLADKRGVNTQQFAELLTPDVIEHAAEQLWESIVLFSPSHQRPALKALMGAQKKAFGEAAEMVKDWIEAPERLEAVRKKVADTISGQ